MLSGDMLFYGAWVSGADFHARQQMAAKSVARLVLGGSLGPIAGILYAMGMGIFYIKLAPGGKRLAGAGAGLLAITMLIGGAYHAVFTNFGFAAKVQDAAVRNVLAAQVRSLYDVLSNLTYFTGIPGTLLVYWTALRKRTLFPRWLLLFIPTVLTLVDTVLNPWFLLLPGPWGGLVRGGWINGCFVVFFAVATVVFWRPSGISPRIQRAGSNP